MSGRDRYRHDYRARRAGAPTPCRPSGGQARRANMPGSGEHRYRAGVTPRARTPTREPEPGGTHRPAGPSSTESGTVPTDQHAVLELEVRQQGGTEGAQLLDGWARVEAGGAEGAAGKGCRVKERALASQGAH